MDHLSRLAWDLLAEIPEATGRLVADPEDAHRRLLVWLSRAANNVGTAEAWLSLWRTERPIDTSSQPPMRKDAMKEYLLRQPIEHALWGQPAGGGFVGFAAHTGRWSSVCDWLRGRRRRR
jgi:hypothetical protein